MKRLKILQVSDLFYPFIGGLEEHVRTLSRELVARGHDVTVATTRLPGTARAETLDGIRVRRLRGWTSNASDRFYERTDARYHPPVPDPGMVAGLANVISEVEPDLIHAQGWMAYSCMAVRVGRRIPLVVTLHDYGFACARKTLMRSEMDVCAGPNIHDCLKCAPQQYGLPIGLALPAALRAARTLHRVVDSWVAISTPVASASRRVVGPHKHISIIPPASSDIRDSESLPSWLPGGPYSLFVGALGRHKGLHWLLSVYEKYPFEFPLVVVGASRGDMPTEWPRGVVVKLDVPHEDVMAVWRHARFGLVPSIWPEPFGLVAVEALRSGVPVIASRVGALPEIIGEGKTGLLVPPRDDVALRNAIRRLEEDDALCARLGRAAVTSALDYSPERITSLYEHHYLGLLSDRGGGHISDAASEERK